MNSKTSGGRIEQRALLRDEQAPLGATVVVRGGSDTRLKLRRHVERTARAWSLDGRSKNYYGNVLPISKAFIFRRSLVSPGTGSTCCQRVSGRISLSACAMIPMKS